ncbi:SAM-dependent methyltransferase [Pseudonocardia sp. TRM90224]|uniref:SAM-dependent methyltransferase n=1 Tax=Pseudonocardia sp. TRM90224 TaxID=2812678 RepID=UPI001E5A0026|nr:SAM-dependent methyltransferase [Pseudonocardia sp. TRM90224]
MTGAPGWSSRDIDYTKPSVARVYDYYLGGSHNFESDRLFGEQALKAMPHLPTILRDNRAFLRRVVRHLTAAGVDQFLDLGSGIPTVGNVHEVAQEVNPQARIVYVDHDPVAIAHSHSLLDGNGRATAISADIRNPRQVVADAVATGLLDLDRPVAVLLIAVLHFVHDHDDPAGIIAGYVDRVAPGSHVAISHARADGQAALRDAAKVYDQDTSPNSMRLRTAAEVQELFGDLTMVPPGVVLLPRWHPEQGDDPDEKAADVPDDYPGLAGLARRD